MYGEIPIATIERKYKFWIFGIRGPYANNLLSRTIACTMGLVLRPDESSTDVLGEIGLLNCEPVKIEFRPEAVPYSLTLPHKRRKKWHHGGSNRS